MISGDGRTLVEELRRTLSLGDGVERFAAGSVPVFAVGGAHVVKLFPPAERAHFVAEWAALGRVDGRLPIPTPRPVAAGERDGWFYIVMTRLSGVSLAEAWPGIGQEHRQHLVREVGTALAALHATPIDGLAPLAVDWPHFMATQRAACAGRQRAKALDAAWVDAIDPFLEQHMPTDDGERVLLHTEVMREHLLVERRDDSWKLSGLVDFEPAMIGAPGYELASVGVFVTCAEPSLLTALLEAYGTEPDDALPYRVMAHALLHRYSSLRWYLERLPHVDTPGDLEALARRWFAA